MGDQNVLGYDVRWCSCHMNSAEDETQGNIKQYCKQGELVPLG